MKPFNLGKKVSGAHGRWKVDGHVHIKNRKAGNFWEDWCEWISRSTMKLRLKREIDELLESS